MHTETGGLEDWDRQALHPHEIQLPLDHLDYFACIFALYEAIRPAEIKVFNCIKEVTELFYFSSDE